MARSHTPVWRLGALSAAILVWSAAGLVPALAEDSQRFYGPHMWGDWHEGWWMFVGPVWLILFLAVVVGVAVLIVRWLSAAGGGGGGGPVASNRPLDILRERFARGEIDKDEFEDRKRALGA